MDLLVLVVLCWRPASSSQIRSLVFVCRAGINFLVFLIDFRTIRDP